MDRTVFNKIHYEPTFSSISGDPRPEYGITGTSGLEGTDAVPLLLLDISLLNKNRYSIIINRNTTIVMPLIIFLICFRSFIDFFSGLPTYSRIRMGRMILKWPRIWRILSGINKNGQKKKS